MTPPPDFIAAVLTGALSDFPSNCLCKGREPRTGHREVILGSRQGHIKKASFLFFKDSGEFGRAIAGEKDDDRLELQSFRTMHG
jgi:hypothetical protein